MFYEYSEKLSVKKTMSKDIPSLKIDDKIRAAIQILSQYKAEIVAVVDGDNMVVGMISKSIIYKLLLDDVSIDTKIAGYYKNDVITVFETDSILETKNKVLGKKVMNAIVIDSDGKYLGSLPRVNIIDELKHMYEFYISELKTLLNTITNGVIKINMNDEIVLANSKALDILGVTENEIMNKKFNAFLPNIELDTWNEITVKKKIIIYKLTQIHKQLNDTSEILITLYDSTDLSNLTEQLEVTTKLKDTLITIINSATDGLIVVDNSETITFCNDGTSEFLAKPKSDIIGCHIYNYMDYDLIKNSKSHVNTIKVNNSSCIVFSYPVKNNTGTVIKIIFNDLSEFKEAVDKINDLEEQVDYLKNKIYKITQDKFGVDRIVGNNSSIMMLKDQIKLTCKSNTTILLLGESGTGKEVFAKAIHEESGRKGKFVKVNCAAIPENLLESEFFGYADGAFTGAKKGGKVGKFELANKGTLFLDEIGDMHLSLQAKLLRVLQDQEFETVGGNTSIRVDVRIIAATNQNLERLVSEGKFRNDLYYRLNVIPMRIPPLRDRKDDIAELSNYILDKLNKKIGTVVSDISTEAIECMKKYDWFGNVRELENILERVINLNHITVILPEHILPHLNYQKVNYNPTSPDAVFVQQQEPDILPSSEKAKVIEALTSAKGNRTKAAKTLGISRTTLYIKIAKYNLE